jgi:hypothetical protein
MQAIERASLKAGLVVAYSFQQDVVLYGQIIHVGQGLAARNAVWVRALDGVNQGKIEFVLLSQIVGIRDGYGSVRVC